MTVELLQPNLAARFQNPLPLPTRIDTAGAGVLTIEMQQAQQWLGLTDDNHNHLLTTIWGYGLQGQTATYPGPTLIAYEGTPVQVRWANSLPSSGFFLPVDMSLHMAMPMDPSIDEGAVPTVVHLHGANVAPQSDGHPDAWFTQNYDQTGEDFVSQIYTYDNNQQAAPLWYHDHALGLTRLNVYAGLVGFYLIRDTNEQQLTAAGVLPGGSFEVEAAIKDQAFTADGQLYRPGFLDDPIPGTPFTVADYLVPNYNGPIPTAVEEFFGDHILVNGMAWPKFDAQPGQYMFRFLNAGDNRFYDLKLSDPNVKVTLVGTDGGLLPNAITIMDGDGVQEANEHLILAPGDRVDLVIDFSHVAGQSVTLLNEGTRFNGFQGWFPDGSLVGGVPAATPDLSVGSVMRFDVATGAPLTNATVTDGTLLNPSFEPLDEALAVKTRRLGLFQQLGNGKDEFGRDHMMLGVMEPTIDENGDLTDPGRLHWDMPITELPELGTTEVWEFYNLTPDAHPVHMHLVQFQVLDRRLLNYIDNGDAIQSAGVAGKDDFSLGPAEELRPEDTGWQDTVWVDHGHVLRVIVHFDRPGEYVWHCHLLTHEDHDMMRPFEVVDDWAGFNVIDGDTGSNTLQGNLGGDVLNGYAGDDLLIGGGNPDIFNGGAGNDTVSYQFAPVGVHSNLADPTENTGEAAGDDFGNSIENLTGSGFDDTLTGDRGANALVGGDGADTLNGLALGDVLLGGAGDDTLNGGAGNDALDGGAGNDAAAFMLQGRSEYDVRTALVGGVLQTRVAHVGGDQSDGADALLGIESLHFTNLTPHLAGAQLNHASSVDGDRFDDVLLRNSVDGQLLYARMVYGVSQGLNLATSPTGLDWAAAATGDVDPNAAGTGGAEIFVQQQSTGTIYYASRDSGAVTWGVVTSALTPDWKLRAVADVNGDASVDAIVQNGTNGTLYFADIEDDGTPAWGVVSTTLTSDWRAMGAGDVTGDGFADVVVQQQSTGTTYYANMANGAFAGWGVVAANLTADWQAKAVADVTGDGFADVVFQNLAGSGGVAPGTTYFARMLDGAFDGWGVVNANVTPDWVVRNAADVDNDGYVDPLFQNQTDGTTYWASMGPNGFESWGGVVGAIGAQWHVV